MTTIATGAAPLLGGVLFGMSAKKSKPNVPDLRTVINEELELLERLPPEQVVRRAALQHAVENHIDELAAATEQSLVLRRRTRSLLEAGKWRDLALFFCVVFFAVIVWEADHERTHWLPMFIAVMMLSVVTAIFALRASPGAFVRCSTRMKTREIPQSSLAGDRVRRPAGSHCPRSGAVRRGTVTHVEESP